MSIQAKTLIWAAIIIGAAFVANSQGLSDGASYGLIAGLTGAAWGSIQSRNVCGAGCLQ
ncbi:hypothetical protein [Altererythrobacter sp.]|uniref:hypothetical protein n=1 Tax=Altererythrobacter sp. TaxID=1872480 RepID=UPI001B03BEAD|nr:hypothetical protein [Altererythrobacter sp.]MBO6609518.1 hypothetical protein [Altererythrobacter sp.]MBO6642385.1 hypothetical protein [Altererythrobacter sp.]MBO6709107.1 hypothetical protein [Altererythrobacter sp.]MBO6944785.1 hypothetical protein [Altererythrobacter sp.]